MRIKKLALWVVLIIFIASVPGCFHCCDGDGDNVVGYEPPDNNLIQDESQEIGKEEASLVEEADDAS